MANFQEINIGAISPEQRAAWEKQLAYLQQQNATHVTPAPVQALLKTGVYEIDAGRNETLRSHEKGTAYASDGLRPGHVFINGIETTTGAARKAGFDVSGAQEGEQRRPFDSVPNRTSQQQPSETERDAFPASQRQTASKTSQESAGGQEDDAAGLTPQEVATAASETIQAIEREHGAHVVDAGLDDVSDSGYLPNEDELPQGVTMAAVEKIVAGYTAQANDALSGVGATVDMLMETLSDDELREARRATIMGDSTKLRHLGARAVSTLAMLPTSDPEAFAEMVEGMRPEERRALQQADNGDWVVTVPGRRPMGFAAAVRGGIVRV